MLTDTARTARAAAVTGWLFPYAEFGGELMDRGGAYWGASREKIEATFETLPAPVLAAFASAVTASAFPVEALADLEGLAGRWLRESFQGADTRQSTDGLGSWLQFADLFAAASVPDLGSHLLVPTLNLYEKLRRRGEGSARRNGYFWVGEAEQGAARAFVLAALLKAPLGVEGTAPPEDTVRLFERHHREPKRVADLVRERRTLDADVLGPILDSGTPAIAAGEL